MNHSSKTKSLFAIVIGLLLFLPTFIYITVKINTGTYLAELNPIISSFNISLLKDFYRSHPTPSYLNVLDFICIIGYLTLSIGTIDFFRYNNSQKIIHNGIGLIFKTLTCIIALIDVVETTITTIGAYFNFDIPNYFLAIHLFGTLFKGLIWIVFIWLIYILVFSLIQFIKGRKAHK